MQCGPDGALPLIHQNLGTPVSSTQNHVTRLADGSNLKDFFVGFFVYPHFMSAFSARDIVAVAAHLSGVHPLKLQVTHPSLKLDFLLAKHILYLIHLVHLVHLESSHEATGDLASCELNISKYLLYSFMMANFRLWSPLSPRLCAKFTNKGTISETSLEHIRKSLLWDDSKFWNCRLHICSVWCTLWSQASSAQTHKQGETVTTPACLTS